jgi:Protein of unknown function (DUF1592)/Protein of unknown function (DUF1588)/Protein of unknown function (DUF1595)/Protein of unknown function (DUF1587)/Protein of unknown function (DUF1585)
VRRSRCSPLGLAKLNLTAVALCLLAALGSGCSGAVDPTDRDGDDSDPPVGGATGGEDGAIPGNPGWLPVHRLNNNEYDNTLGDLLGVPVNVARTTFPADEVLYGYDSIASALAVNDARFEQYIEAADAVVEKVFATSQGRDRIVNCATGGGDLSSDRCVESFVSTFGRKAFRRPLESDEIARLKAVATAAIELGATPEIALRQVVKTMLSSPQFLYRFEAGPGTGEKPTAVDPYAMASRLSYLLWSTTPDDELLDAAESGKLGNVEGVREQFSRLMASPRSQQLAANAAGQWLGMRELAGHQVEPTAFPDWDEDLRQSVGKEQMAYIQAFVAGDRPMSEFFTADMNFVDGRLARHYGMLGVAGDTLEKVSDDSDARRGFLGLAGFLTLTSFSYRTAPTLRGIWVLQNLLCEEIPAPPAEVPQLDQGGATDQNAQAQSVRQRLEAHRSNPGCASCHNFLDPIGMGLENFDAIGRYRDAYPNGDRVDASGELPDGTVITNLNELSDSLAGDDRFANCAVNRFTTYALARGLTESDDPYREKLTTRWNQHELSLPKLLEEIVLSGPFRYRSAEPLDLMEDKQ